MCQIFELSRAFILRPHKLHKSGTLLQQIADDFEDIQKGFDGELEILLLKDGGFIICLPTHFSQEEAEEATRYLEEKLDILPRLVDLAQVV